MRKDAIKVVKVVPTLAPRTIDMLVSNSSIPVPANAIITPMLAELD